MDVSSHSFQDVFKLMTSMTAFETLLNAANLNPDVCIQLGIHEQFKQLQEKVGKCIKHDNTTDLNVRCVCTLCSEEIKILNFDIRTSLAIHNAGEVHRAVVKQKQLDKMYELNTKEHSVPMLQPHTVDMNNIPQELRKSSPGGVPSLALSGHVVNNLNNVSDAACFKCQQTFCICGFKQKPVFGLSEKLTNLNVSTSNVSNRPLFPTAPHHPKFGQQHIPRGRNPSPQNRSNKKHQEDKTRSKSHVETSLKQPSINIHVHMPPGADQSASAATQPTVQADKKNTVEENLEKLRTRRLAAHEQIQLMFKMVRDADGKNWRRGNYTQDGNEYICNVCNTGTRINCPYDVVMHVRGKSHQDHLKSTCSVRNSNPQNRTQNRGNNRERRAQSQQNDYEFNHEVVGFLNDSNMELLKNHTLDEDHEYSLMLRMVEEAEGERWQQSHFSRRGTYGFCCEVCNINLNSSYQVVQHAQGQSHDAELANDKCVVM